MSKSKFAGTKSSWSNPYPDTIFPTPHILLDEELTMRVCAVQGRSGHEKAMVDFLVDHLLGLGLEPLFDKKGNMYCVKGEGPNYPCMVAHLDTVHSYQEAFHIHKSANGKVLYAFNEETGQQAGIGGDDRVGIAVALQLLSVFDNFKVAFFVEEETGCVGSRAAAMSFFKDTTLVLQCDRQGDDDWVQTVAGTQVSSDAFIAQIKPLLAVHKYTTIQSGGITDVGQLKKNGLGVCAANMSCGYYRPHSSEETIFLPAMQNTLNLCHSVYTLLGNTVQPHEYVPYVAPKSTYTGGNYADRPNYYPNATNGWTWRQIKDTDSKVWGVYLYEKKVEGVVVLGPMTYEQATAAEEAWQKEGIRLKKEADEKALKKKKAAVKAWIDEDGSWSLSDGKPKLWRKLIGQDLPNKVNGWYVCYANTILEIPAIEKEFQAVYGKQLLQGTMSPKQIVDDINRKISEAKEARRLNDELAARLEKDHDEELEELATAQLKNSMKKGERDYDGFFTDDDRDDEEAYERLMRQWDERDEEAKKALKDKYKVCACPHCGTEKDRYTFTDGAFYCDDCAMYSDEVPEELEPGTSVKVVDGVRYITTDITDAVTD